VLDSSTCSPNHVPTISDPLAPFRDLPLATHPDILAIYMHPDASWRITPLDSANGSIVQRFRSVDLHRDFDKIDAVNGGNISINTNYDDTNYTFKCPRGITMGLFYDLIISWDHPGYYGNRHKKGWKLLFGVRVRHPENFDIRQSWTGPDIPYGQVEAQFVQDERYAILLNPGIRPSFRGESYEGDSDGRRVQGSVAVSGLGVLFACVSRKFCGA
jgi:hypothetical protein